MVPPLTSHVPPLEALRRAALPARLWRAMPAWLALLLTLSPLAATANGNHTHIGITLRAIDLLPEGPLRALVSDPTLRPMLLNGTIFPDGGYAIQHPYGEAAHWEPMQRALQQRVLAACPAPLASQACREKLVFLLGMASHGMADQVFDALYMEAAKLHDKAGWTDSLLESFDSSTDVLWAAAHGGLEIPALWLPMEDLLATYQALQLPVEAATITNGQNMLREVVLAYVNMARDQPDKVEAARSRYPWGAAHLDDAHVAGSPPSEARVVAAYWQQLWATWIDGAPPRLEVLATMPTHGGAGVAVDPADPASVLAVIVSRGLDKASVQDSDIEVQLGSATAKHDCRVHLFYGQDSHVLRVLPQQPWPPGSAQLSWKAATMQSFDGHSLAADGAITFAVGPANATPPGAPPPGWSLAAADAGPTGADAGGGPGAAAGGATAPADSGCGARRRGPGPVVVLGCLAALASWAAARRGGRLRPTGSP